MTSMRPVPAMYGVTQGYYGTFSTQYSGGAYHGGTDFATPVGTPVVAPDDGEIIFADWAWNLPGGPFDWTARYYQLKPAVNDTRTGGGILTMLRNDVGSVWIFAHLSSNDAALKGKRVRRGDVIGLTGNTGSSTGPHLHLALIPKNPNWNNGAYGAINAAPFLTIAYRPNTVSSWVGSPTTGTGTGAPSKSVALPEYKFDKLATANYYTPATALQVYKQPRVVVGVTIHWWNTPEKAGSHDGTASFLARDKGNTSAHYVVSPGRVTELVAPQNVAWHAGSATGNVSTVGIECDPRDISGTLATVAALIQKLEKQYGSLKIYAHSDWTATTCPGGYRNRIGELVEMVNRGATAAIVTKDWFDMATKKDLLDALREHDDNRGSAHMRGSANDVLSRNGSFDGQALDNIADAVWNRVLRERGSASGNMTAQENEEWVRDERAKAVADRISTAKKIEKLQADVETILVALNEILNQNKETENNG